jgi:hypothetical protein
VHRTYHHKEKGCLVLTIVKRRDHTGCLGSHRVLNTYHWKEKGSHRVFNTYHWDSTGCLRRDRTGCLILTIGKKEKNSLV